VSPTNVDEVKEYINLRFLMGLLYCSLYIYTLVFNNVIYCMASSIMTLFGALATISLVSAGFKWLSWDLVLYVPLYQVNIIFVRISPSRLYALCVACILAILLKE
jgi:glucan phosphoethanolaminetransferase (alkaline phosphatase superfamily)